jgi:ABC-type lipoprotein release transport system permease subunit
VNLDTIRLALAVCVGFLLILLVAIGRVPVRYNLRCLLVRWRTCLLTVSAFGVVVGLVTVMVAFVESMYRVTAVSGRATNVIVLSDGATDEMLSSLDYSAARDIEFHPALARDSRGPLASWEVYVVITQPVAGASGARRFIQFRGVEDPTRASAIRGLTTHPNGNWFSATGVQRLADGSTAIEAVLGEGIASELGKDRGKPRLDIGDVFEAGPRMWVVVGILNSAGSVFDAEVWAPRVHVGQTFGRDGYTTLLLAAENPARARELADSLNRDYKKAPVNAIIEPEYYEKFNTTNRQFLQVAIVVTIILALGGVFGTINAMSASVAQRAKDIGVLRALGYRRRQILASFLFEVLLIAFAGGVLGCSLAYLVDGWSVTSIAGSGQGTGKSIVLTLTVTREILLTGMLFALTMGGIAGLVPAVAATRVRPADALR